jgi:hypothetical protein
MGRLVLYMSMSVFGEAMATGAVISGRRTFELAGRGRRGAGAAASRAAG